MCMCLDRLWHGGGRRELMWRVGEAKASRGHPTGQEASKDPHKTGRC